MSLLFWGIHMYHIKRDRSCISVSFYPRQVKASWSYFSLCQTSNGDLAILQGEARTTGHNVITFFWICYREMRLTWESITMIIDGDADWRINTIWTTELVNGPDHSFMAHNAAHIHHRDTQQLFGTPYWDNFSPALTSWEFVTLAFVNVASF